MSNHDHFMSFLLVGDIITNRLWDEVGQARRDIYAGFVSMQVAPLVIKFMRRYGDVTRHLNLNDDGFLVVSAWYNDRVDITRQCSITRKDVQEYAR